MKYLVVFNVFEDTGPEGLGGRNGEWRQGWTEHASEPEARDHAEKLRNHRDYKNIRIALVPETLKED